MSMNILGVIGSARKLGNCELIVKEILLHVQEQGVEVRALRLPDYKLLPCKGCLACVMKGEPCRLEDDMHELWDHFEWADAIVLSAPTYFLGPAGIIKLLIDRLFEYSLQIGKKKQRPGAIIATAGLREWDPFTLPMLSMLAGILRLNLVDRFVAYRPGPGEVLLDDETMTRVQSLGDKLIEKTRNSEASFPIPISPNGCPNCGTIFFQMRSGNTIECQLCQVQGTLAQHGETYNITWSIEGQKNRWSPEAMAEHFSEWVLRTGPVYQSLREEIMLRIEKYRKIPITSKI
jgi:multimeric flavodoxin WrbA